MYSNFAANNHLEYDILFVGAGLSTTATLISFLEKLEEIDCVKPVRIAIVEKSNDIYQGIAYGRRSGTTSLLINEAHEFFPEKELVKFVSWFTENKLDLLDRYEKEGGSFATEWLLNNKKELDAGALSSLYLPRFIVGDYWSHQAYQAVGRSELHRKASVVVLQAEVLDIKRKEATNKTRNSFYTLSCIDNNSVSLNILASTIVLATGSPPSIPITIDENKLIDCEKKLIIQNPFEPGLNQTIENIKMRLEPANNQLVVIGSNASGMDLLCNLYSNIDVLNRISKIIVMSPSGLFPETFQHDASRDDEFCPANIEMLSKKDMCDAEDIYTAVAKDIEDSKTQQFNIADTLPIITRAMVKQVMHLDANEKRKFAEETGAKIGKLQRRAGSEYAKVIEKLIKAKKLQILSGKLTRVTSGNVPGSLAVHYSPSQKECLTEEIVELTPVNMVVNCMGAQKYSESHCPSLLKSMVANGLCSFNGSDLALTVDDELCADGKGIYCIGPLQAGNVIANRPIWHMEHCGRILDYAEQLAAHLITTNGERESQS